MPRSSKGATVVARGAVGNGSRRPRDVKLNRLWRLGFFFVGLVLFYAPFALVSRLTGALFPGTMPATWTSDVHTACMRMPVGWLAQPWMWSSLDLNPLYYVPIIVLRVALPGRIVLRVPWQAGPRPVQVGSEAPRRDPGCPLRVLRRLPHRAVH